jgi:hypothetical protein
MNMAIRSKQRKEHPQIPVNEEMRSFDVEMNPSSLVEGCGSKMKTGEPLTAQVMDQKGHRIEADTVLHDHDFVAAGAL